MSELVDYRLGVCIEKTVQEKQYEPFRVRVEFSADLKGKSTRKERQDSMDDMYQEALEACAFYIKGGSEVAEGTE